MITFHVNFEFSLLSLPTYWWSLSNGIMYKELIALLRMSIIYNHVRLSICPVKWTRIQSTTSTFIGLSLFASLIYSPIDLLCKHCGPAEEHISRTYKPCLVIIVLETWNQLIRRIAQLWTQRCLRIDSLYIVIFFFVKDNIWPSLVHIVAR